MKNREEAERYLRRTLKTDKPLLDEKALKDIKFKRVTVNHVELCNTLAKLACVTPMPSLSRKIILYKLANPGITDIQIALMAGIRATEVMAYEFEGKGRMNRYMEKVCEQEIIDKANSNDIVYKEVQNLKAKKAPGGANKLE